MGKATITQRSFILGALREGFLEADDLEARGQSVRSALNMRVTATRGLQERPGLRYRYDAANVVAHAEIRPADAAPVLLLVRSTGGLGIGIVNANWANEAYIFTPGITPAPGDVWISPGSERTIIGGSWGIYELKYNGGSWQFNPLSFADSPGGEKAQPYWAFHPGVTITPSGYTGSVTVTASSPIFHPPHVGTRIRYNRKEILITGFTNTSTVTGTVVSELPQNYRIQLASLKGFQVGDAVIGTDTDFQGVIVSIDPGAGTIDVTTLEFFDGPDVAENLACASNSAEVVAKTPITPLASSIWDEQLMSAVRGYPRSGTVAAGRLFLTNFPLVPDVVAVSSTRNLSDFEVGSRDDDAIVRQIGDNTPRILHAVNAGDVLLFSDRGLYYINIRDGKLLTPASFNAIQFDARASSPVRPVQVEDGVVFVEASGQSIAACLLDGNIYLKWSVRPISLYHSHLIKNPVSLCGPSLFSQMPEKYLFVTNGDGTVAAMSWFNSFSPETIGFIPWDTDGTFKGAVPVFGNYAFIVNRDGYADPLVAFDRFEELNESCRVDEAHPGASTFALFGETERSAHVGDRDYGQIFIPAGGSLAAVPNTGFVGRPFVCRVQPWPAEHIQTPRAGMLKARLIRGAVSVQGTGVFKIRANNSIKQVGGYSAGDDFSAPPPNKTEVYRFLVLGNRDHPEIEFIRDTPARLRIMAVTQEVQT